MIDGFFSIITEPRAMQGLWVCVGMSEENFNRLLDGADTDLIRERLMAVEECGLINPERPVVASRIDGEIVLMQRSFSFN